LLVAVEGAGRPRTEGDPVTVWTLWQDCRAAIERAAHQFQIRPGTIVGTICCESIQESPDWWRRDPESYRREPDGRESGGLMQTLVSTAQRVNSKFGLYYNLDGEAEIDLEDLYVRERSIMLGAAYLLELETEQGADDPVLQTVAYNAGGLYETEKNDWNLRCYHAGRVEKFAAYYNDFQSLEVT